MLQSKTLNYYRDALGQNQKLVLVKFFVISLTNVSKAITTLPNFTLIS